MDAEARHNTRVLAAVGRGGATLAMIAERAGMTKGQAECALQGLVDGLVLVRAPDLLGGGPDRFHRAEWAPKPRPEREGSNGAWKLSKDHGRAGALARWGPKRVTVHEKRAERGRQQWAARIERYREVLRLHREGLGPTAIGERLGIQPQNVVHARNAALRYERRGWLDSLERPK
jgi:DNA-binding CsgD family transcriptional regulator